MKSSTSNFYPLLKLAIPMSMTSLLGSAIFFCHTLFLAKLGSDILAAGALASYLTARKAPKNVILQASKI